MKVAVYVRVSTAGQNEAGQRRDIARWLEGNGLEATYFVDQKCGDDLNRPAFERLRAAVFAGEVKTVVCWKLDRLSRSLQDGINTLCDWLKAGIRVVSVTQQLDFSGPVGKLVATVLFAVAEMEQESRRERQSSGIGAVLADPAKRAEKYPGRKPGSTKAAPAEARRLLALGLKRDEIAKQLSVTTRSVARYLAS